MTMLWPTTAQPARNRTATKSKTELKIVAPERHLRL